MLKYISSLSILLPFTVCIFLVSITYRIDSELDIAIPLISSFLLIFLADLFLNKKSKTLVIDMDYSPSKNSEKLSALFFYFSLVIFVLGIVDLIHHGIVIFNPGTYDKFTFIQAWNRYFSSLSWTLLPIAMLFKFRLSARVLFMVWSILFPILSVDRNRLLMAIFTGCICFLFLDFDKKKKKIFSFVLVSTCLVAGIVLFSLIGSLKNNLLKDTYIASSVKVPTGNDCNLPSSLPVKPEFKTFPPMFQWVFLYGLTPTYNLAVQYKCEIQDSSLLKAQVIPLWKKNNPVGTPYLVASNMNASTEVVAFYMAWGTFGIFFCILVAFAINRYFLSKYLLTHSVFDLLIVLRLSYCSAFMGFAPQYFIWTNLGFILVMKALEVFFHSPYSEFLGRSFFPANNRGVHESQN